MNEDDILDVSWLNLEGDFDTQVENVLNAVRLTREEVEHLRILYQDLELALRTRWADCKVIPFGSIVTGMGIKTSDADCYVDIPSLEKNKNTAANCVKKAKLTLMQFSHFRDLFAIITAKVPIVQFTHVPTQIHCDVSFTSRMGARNSELMSFLLQLDKRALPLAILIKYWSKVHSLTGMNKLPNYSLIMMILFYLQQLDILPSVEFLQRSMPNPDIVEGWDTSFDCSRARIPPTKNNASIKTLLGGFFKYYRDFDFKENIICPYLGHAIKREVFSDLDNVPVEFEIYLHSVRQKKELPLRINTCFCIQDPFQHNRNCAVAVYPRLEITVRLYIDLAARIYEECGHHDMFLREILIQSPNEVPELLPHPKQKQNDIINARANNYKVMKRKHKIQPFKHVDYNLQNCTLSTIQNNLIEQFVGVGGRGHPFVNRGPGRGHPMNRGAGRGHPRNRGAGRGCPPVNRGPGRGNHTMNGDSSRFMNGAVTKRGHYSRKWN